MIIEPLLLTFQLIHRKDNPMLVLFQNLILQLDNGDYISIGTGIVSALVAIGLYLFERRNRKNQFKDEKKTDHTYELINKINECKNKYIDKKLNEFFNVNVYEYSEFFKQHLQTGYPEIYHDLTEVIRLENDETAEQKKLYNTIKEKVTKACSKLQIMDHSIPDTSVRTGNTPTQHSINYDEATYCLIDVLIKIV
jgi:hypothetical protein